MQNVGAVEFAAIGDAFERPRSPFVERARKADFDARGAGGGVLQFARRAQGDHASVIHDGDAIAQALGFFDVVRGQQNGFLARASAPR